jgi:hypothetical protein
MRKTFSLISMFSHNSFNTKERELNY